MKTRTWEFMCTTGMPLKGEKVRFIDSPLRKPEGVDEAIRINWNKQLAEKQLELAEKNIVAEIKPYHEDKSNDPLGALYHEDAPKMWPGPAVSLKLMESDGSYLNLLVGQTFYPFIAGLNDEKISNLYVEQGIDIPRPALGICTFALTSDEQIALTVRGALTNVYPGRFYGQGGNAKFVDTNVIEHQTQEMIDEILVEPSDYSTENFRFGGLVLDMEVYPGKPDLVGWIPVNMEAEDIRERVYQRPLADRPPDVIGIAFAPNNATGLLEYLTNSTHPIHYCPSANAGLVLYGAHKFGLDWAQEVVDRLE